MPTVRDIKRKARRELHKTFAVPALYVAAPGDAGTLISVRVHTKFDAVGMQGAEAGLASRREVTPRIIFMREELAEKGIVPARKAIVSVEAGEAYMLDNADAPDDITVAFFVNALPVEKTVDLPVPVTSDG